MPQNWPTDYGVDTDDGGNVVVRLGAVPPFEIAPDAAIKLAALLLKKAGAKVEIRNGVITADTRPRAAKRTH